MLELSSQKIIPARHVERVRKTQTRQRKTDLLPDHRRQLVHVSFDHRDLHTQELAPRALASIRDPHVRAGPRSQHHHVKKCIGVFKGAIKTRGGGVKICPQIGKVLVRGVRIEPVHFIIEIIF